MSYNSNALGQENALGYPYPKWHPYYGWGGGAPRQPTGMIGDPGLRPPYAMTAPGNWFGRPVVGALASIPKENAMVVQAGAGLLVGGAAYLATKSVIGALLGGGAAALLVTLLPIWQDGAGGSGPINATGWMGRGA